ncbi:MAG: DJ-1/PfpI family protein [Gammaproteobacteria bacterium]|nr:DJ-1/PfpI family protein [Gammaproteobacteria bacterium]MCF6230991.1 DJ-1/PfpI family protein [Gammaproteobacteria bacterium]
MASVLIPLAQGCEELEAVTLIDLLRRAGVDVVTAGLDDQAVVAAHGVTLIPDTTLDEALKKTYEMIILPGGMPGSNHLQQDERLKSALINQNQQGKYIAAICAAPKILAAAGILNGRYATSYPGFLDKMERPEVEYLDEMVVHDDNIITSTSPGSAMDFALYLVEVLMGEARRDKVEEGLVRPAHHAIYDDEIDEG